MKTRLNNFECHDVSFPPLKRQKLNSSKVNSNTKDVTPRTIQEPSSLKCMQTPDLSTDCNKISFISLQLFSNDEDNNECSWIYSTLESISSKIVNNIVIPSDILKIIAFNATGQIRKCHECKLKDIFIINDKKYINKNKAYYYYKSKKKLQNKVSNINNYEMIDFVFCQKCIDSTDHDVDNCHSDEDNDNYFDFNEYDHNSEYEYNVKYMHICPQCKKKYPDSNYLWNVKYAVNSQKKYYEWYERQIYIRSKVLCKICIFNNNMDKCSKCDTFYDSQSWIKNNISISCYLCDKLLIGCKCTNVLCTIVHPDKLMCSDWYPHQYHHSMQGKKSTKLPMRCNDCGIVCCLKCNVKDKIINNCPKYECAKCSCIFCHSQNRCALNIDQIKFESDLKNHCKECLDDFVWFDDNIYRCNGCNMLNDVDLNLSHGCDICHSDFCQDCWNRCGNIECDNHECNINICVYCWIKKQNMPNGCPKCHEYLKSLSPVLVMCPL